MASCHKQFCFVRDAGEQRNRRTGGVCAPIRGWERSGQPLETLPGIGKHPAGAMVAAAWSASRGVESHRPRQTSGAAKAREPSTPPNVESPDGSGAIEFVFFFYFLLFPISMFFYFVVFYFSFSIFYFCLSETVRIIQDVQQKGRV